MIEEMDAAARRRSDEVVGTMKQGGCFPSVHAVSRVDDMKEAVRRVGDAIDLRVATERAESLQLDCQNLRAELDQEQRLTRELYQRIARFQESCPHVSVQARTGTCLACGLLIQQHAPQGAADEQPFRVFADAEDETCGSRNFVCAELGHARAQRDAHLQESQRLHLALESAETALRLAREELSDTEEALRLAARDLDIVTPDGWTHVGPGQWMKGARDEFGAVVVHHAEEHVTWRVGQGPDLLTTVAEGFEFSVHMAIAYADEGLDEAVSDAEDKGVGAACEG